MCVKNTAEKAKHVNAVTVWCDDDGAAVLLTASDDHTLGAWHLDAAAAAPPVLLACFGHGFHSDFVFSCALHRAPGADLHMLSAGADGRLALWRLKGDNSVELCHAMLGHRSDKEGDKIIRGCAIHPSGKVLASAGCDRTVRLWDAGSGAQLRVLRGHTDKVYCVAFSPDGAMLASTGIDGTVRLWAADGGRALAALPSVAPPQQPQRLWHVAWSPKGNRVLATGDDGMLRVWARA